MLHGCLIAVLGCHVDNIAEFGLKKKRPEENRHDADNCHKIV
jgi:hypothetical protein